MGAAFIGACAMKKGRNRRFSEIQAEKEREETKDAFFCLLSVPLAIFVFYFFLLILE